jgi:hypothetical protein
MEVAGRSGLGALACQVGTMKGNTATRRLYVELTAHLIDREIAKFRRGEQAALVSFTNVAKLARNASEELAALARERVAALPPTLRRRSSKRHGRGTSAAYGQAPEF